MPSWTAIYALAFWPLLLVCAAASLRWGDRAVRLASLVLLIGMIAAQIALSGSAYRTFEAGGAAADLAMLVGLIGLSIRYPRMWLMILASIQLLSTLAHLAKAMSFDMTRLSYAILQGGGAYFQLAVLTIGLLSAIRTRRSGIDRSATV